MATLKQKAVKRTKQAASFAGKHKKKAAAMLAVAVAVIFFSSAFFQEKFFDAISFAEAYMEGSNVLGMAVFILFAAFSVFIVLFTSAPLVPPAVALWGAEMVLFLLLAGWILGGIIAYGIGRYAAYPLFRKMRIYEKTEEYRSKIPETKQFWIVLLFRLALPAEIPSYALGMLKYNFLKYIIITAIAELPFALITVYASEALVTLQPGKFASLFILGAALFALLYWLFRKVVK